MPDVTLVDEQGESVHLPTLLGRRDPVVLQFVFTSCTAICPPLSGTMAALGRRVEPSDGDVLRLTITIDPEHDTPARLAAFADRFDGRRGWRLLTGAVDDVAAVQRAFGVYKPNKMQHRPLTFVRRGATPWLRIEGFPSAGALLAELRRLPVE